MPRHVACLLSGMVLFVGCDQPAATSPAPAKSVTSAPTGAPAVTAEPEDSEPETTRSVARVGSGKKGHSYGSNMITAPAASLWRTKERIVFEIQIPEALKLYKNLNPKYEGPQSHEEFMEQIIKANHIKLPELPDRHRYVYDPEKEQLMIERPAR